MTKHDNADPSGMPAGLGDEIQKKAERRVRARSQKKYAVWFGLGMFGLIGWSVAIPTLLGILLGLWLDRHWPEGRISWTITLLFVGIILGCLNAWRWVSRQRKPESPPDSEAESDE